MSNHDSSDTFNNDFNNVSANPFNKTSTPMSSQSHEVLRLEALKKSYNIGQPNEIEVLHGIDLTISNNDFAALIGPSGSGKSTLLNVLGLLDQPTSGELYLLGSSNQRYE